MIHELHLKQIKTISFLLLAIAAVGYVYQYGRSIDQSFPQRTFTVQGEANIETPHDIAFFTATVITEGESDVTKLQSANAEKMNAINAFLQEKGIEKKDLKTTNYAMNPRYNYPNCTPGTGICPPPSINGYSITQSLEVKVRDTGMVGDLLTGIVSAGANSVSGVSFITDDDSEARNLAREEAFQDGRKKALAMAKAGNFRLGKLVSFYEDNSSPIQPYAMNAMAASDAMGGAEAKAVPSPTIEPGTETGKLQVNLTFEIR